VALGCRPRLLIADEPTTALDVTTQAEMMELLRDVQRQTGMAILLISHDLGLVASICDKIYVMYAGRTIEWGFQDEVFGSPCHPYTRGLLAAAEGERTKDGYFITIAGDVPDLREAAGGCPFEPRCSWARRECGVMPEATEIGPGNTHFVCCYVAQEISSLAGAAT
jgi:oligopeptide/dipeptide ABC transporter ATP-binding protein